jgi:hypothetical protein
MTKELSAAAAANSAGHKKTLSNNFMSLDFIIT